MIPFPSHLGNVLLNIFAYSTKLNLEFQLLLIKSKLLKISIQSLQSLSCIINCIKIYPANAKNC